MKLSSWKDSYFYPFSFIWSFDFFFLILILYWNVPGRSSISSEGKRKEIRTKGKNRRQYNNRGEWGEREVTAIKGKWTGDESAVLRGAGFAEFIVAMVVVFNFTYWERNFGGHCIRKSFSAYWILPWFSFVFTSFHTLTSSTFKQADTRLHKQAQFSFLIQLCHFDNVLSISLLLFFRLRIAIPHKHTQQKNPSHAHTLQHFPTLPHTRRRPHSLTSLREPSEGKKAAGYFLEGFRNLSKDHCYLERCWRKRYWRVGFGEM